MKQIALYIVISVIVSLGIGYSAGHYVASSKAERDVAAIRAILEEQRAEEKKQEEEHRAWLESLTKHQPMPTSTFQD